MSYEALTEERKLTDLIPHPLQDQYYAGLDEHALNQLAEDIERHDLRELIEILPENTAGLPPNTIISGHQRCRALQLLGYEETDVWVRYDLADAPAEVIEQYLLDSNQHRQHLSKLQQARIALRSYELEKNRDPGELRQWEQDEARDRVGQQIGMSGRNLQRYFRVLKTPIEVQHAFEEKRLSLVEASEVAGFSREQQEEIIAGIKEGCDAKSVVGRFRQKRRTVRPIHELMRQFGAKLTQEIDQAEEAILPRIEELYEIPISPHHLVNIKKASEFLSDYLARLEEIASKLGEEL